MKFKICGYALLQNALLLRTWLSMANSHYENHGNYTFHFLNCIPPKNNCIAITTLNTHLGAQYEHQNQLLEHVLYKSMAQIT
ncbi:hypothetical protein AMTRI_Chr08g160910 [Amborella trichopoda]